MPSNELPATVAYLDGRLRATTRLGQMMNRRGPKLGVETTHCLGDARPAMLGGPAHCLRAHAIPLAPIGEQLPEMAGQRFGVTFGHQMAGDAVLDRRGEA